MAEEPEELLCELCGQPLDDGVCSGCGEPADDCICEPAP
jgi:hypothetical protein